MNRLSSRAGIVTIALASIVTASLAVAVIADSGGGPANASSSSDNHTITVSGDGTGYGVPDTLVANLSVHSHESSADAALQTANTDMQHVMDTLKNKGAKPSDLQTTDLELNQSYDNHGNINGYDATESLSVRIPLKGGGGLLSAASSAAGNAVSFDGISLDVSDKSKALDQARMDAFNQAYEAAKTDAQLAGETLGKVVSIKETQESSTPPPFYGYADGLAAAAPEKSVPISAGKQSVTVTLDIVWSIND